MPPPERFCEPAYDKTEKVIDNAEATAMLSRERRKGYELPTI